jgi:hypothetical protein
MRLAAFRVGLRVAKWQWTKRKKNMRGRREQQKDLQLTPRKA